MIDDLRDLLDALDGGANDSTRSLAPPTGTRPATHSESGDRPPLLARATATAHLALDVIDRELVSGDLDLRDATDALSKAHGIIAHTEKLEAAKRGVHDLPVIHITIGGHAGAVRVEPVLVSERSEAPPQVEPRTVSVADHMAGVMRVDFEPLGDGGERAS